MNPLFFSLLFLASCQIGYAQNTKNKPSVTFLYGNSFVERLQEDGTFEALLHVAEPNKRHKLRSFAYSGDEVGFRIRPEKFGEHLGFISKQLTCDRVIMCFGMNESFAGVSGIEAFKKDLNIYLEIIKDRHRGAEMILVSPTAVEKSDVGVFPNVENRNADIKAYCDAMKEVAAKNDVSWVDLFTPSQKLFSGSEEPLTFNSLHLNSTGNQRIAEVFANLLVASATLKDINLASEGFNSLRKMVSRKAYETAMAYRPANGIHYYGVRARSYEYTAEIPHHLHLADLIDEAIWKQASDLSRVEPFPELPTNQAVPSPKAPKKGLGKILTSEEDLKTFTVADGFEVNLFASSEDFPELINPLQINFDAQGRLWVVTFASYPIPIPGTLSDDKVLIFEDTDGDGKADKRTVFADRLKLPDGFVFYRDGIIVSVARQLLWLRDTDGDDVADVSQELFRGADDTDTHHGGYLARTPQGQVVYCEGLFHRGQFETPHGLVRTKDATALYWDPHTHSLSIERQTTTPNPWKISYNKWGESVQMFGGGQLLDCELYNVSTPVGVYSPAELGGLFGYGKGCGMAHVSSTHFPEDWQGGLVTGHLLGKNTVHFTPLELVNGTYTKGSGALQILSSSNASFRPVDFSFGLDGALYVSDFYYPIIGHAQHSIRDKNRDYTNGRIWRVTRKGVELSKAPEIKGASMKELFDLLTHPQVRVRELAREQLENHPVEKVLKMAKSMVSKADENGPLGLELLWLFERAKDFSQKDLLKKLLVSKSPEIRHAATRSIRRWAPVLGKEAHQLASNLWQTGDVRTQVALISVASYLRDKDTFWQDFIDNAEAEPNTKLATMIELARGYRTPSIKPEFPLLKVDPSTKLSGWLTGGSAESGTLIVRSDRKQEAVLGFRSNSSLNIDLNYVPLRRATGSVHMRNGQFNVTLEKGDNQIRYFLSRGKRPNLLIDLYIANLIGNLPEGITFPADEEEHRKWNSAYDAANATVTADRIRIKAVPSKMAFNVKEFRVRAGHTYQFTFENPDHMLHNLLIVKPGKAAVVGAMADTMAAQAGAMEKHFIPDADLILFSTPQIPYGEKFEANFTTPEKPGRYPVLCTFPGHWRMMTSMMIVEKEKSESAGKKTTLLKKASPKSPLKNKGDEILVYQGKSGPGFGKHIVFIASDHEYHSEETCPAIARILAKRFGFKCTVLFGQDDQGHIKKGSNYIPGMEVLADADLLFLFLRFQDWKADQMEHLISYLKRGGPVIGLRTTTHAFKIKDKSGPYARFSDDYKGDDFAYGFGKQILGLSWSKYGGHYSRNHLQSVRIDVVPEKSKHPINLGVRDGWAYGGGYKAVLGDECDVLAMAQPLVDIYPNSEVLTEKPPMPAAWTRSYQFEGGPVGKVFTTIYGGSPDIVNGGFRRMLINAVFWASDLADKIDPNANVNFVGPFTPTFGRYTPARERLVKPSDLAGWTAEIFPHSEMKEDAKRLFTQKQLDDQVGE